MRNRFAVVVMPIASIVLAGSIIASYEAGAARALRAQPSSVATVRINDVLTGLDQFKEVQTELEQMGQGIQQEADTQQQAVQELREKLRNMPEGRNKQRQSLEEQLVITQYEFQAWYQFKSEQVDVERSLLLRDLYRSIKDAVADMSETEGYDLVLMDESDQPIQVNPQSDASREQQVREQIRSRRILYSGQVIDITEDLIERMNNAFNAGRGGR